MPKVTFFRGYQGDPFGFAPVSPRNVQISVLARCKETFSRRLVGWNARQALGRPALEVSKRGTVKFLHKSTDLITPELAARKTATLRVFEEAMGFKPPAKCQIVTNVMGPNRIVKSYLLYEVSASWAKSHPVAHILALLVRGRYPVENVLAWPEIVEWMNKTGQLRGAKAAVYEIIAAKGELRPNTPELNGITEYGRVRGGMIGRF